MHSYVLQNGVKELEKKRIEIPQNGILCICLSYPHIQIDISSL